MLAITSRSSINCNADFNSVYMHHFIFYVHPIVDRTASLKAELLKLIASTVFQEVLSFLGKLKARIKCPRYIGKYALLTLISAMLYGVVFSYLTVLRHDAFFSAAWDLGNFNQAFYTTLHDWRLFYYTADVFFSPSGSVFAIHTSPFLFLLIPFYAISPSSETLLVLKAFGIGLAAIPLYMLAKHFLDSSKAAFTVGLVYLLYAPLHGANWFDFQQSAFIPLFVFLTYFFMVKKNWKLYFPTMALTLLIEEHVAVIIGILAALFLSYQIGWKTISKSARKLKTDVNVAAVATIVTCVVYLFTAMFVKNSFPVSVDFSAVYRASGNFQILGSSDTITLPIYALLHPTQAFQALVYDFPLKFFYVIFLFAPMLFIPLRNRFVLGILFILSPFLLSNYRPYYMLGIHYPLYIIPLIFIGAIYGLFRLDRNARTFSLRTIMVVTLVFAVSVSPLSPISNLFTPQNYAQYSPIQLSLDQNKQSLNALLKLVPSDDSILTQNLIFPHVSSRMNAYVIPFSDFGQPNKMGQYLDNLLSNSTYVLLDLQSLSTIDQIVLDKISEDNYYGPYALGSESILFKKGYAGQPINAYYVEDRTFVASHDSLIQTPPNSIVDDPTSSTGKVVSYPKGAPGFCMYGPYIYLLPGAYDATFTIKVSEHGPECLGTLDIATDGATNIPSLRDVYGFELKTNEWTNITVPFGLTTLKNRVEFRVYSTGVAEMQVDRIVLRRVSSTPALNFNLRTVRLTSMKIDNGNITESGFFVHYRGSNPEVFWYGPYWTYLAGNYSINFALKTEPIPLELNSTVLTLSISGKTSDVGKPTVIKDRVLYAQEFVDDSGSEWHSFTLDFTLEKTMSEVEFRGLWPSPNFDIYLASIQVEAFD